MSSIFKLSLLLILYLFLFSSTPVIAKEAVKASLINISLQERIANIILQLDIKENWKLYAYNNQHVLPISIELVSDDISEYKPLWPAYKTTHHKNMNINYFEGKILVPVTVNLNRDPEQLDYTVIIKYAACSDICITEQISVSSKMKQGFSSKDVSKTNISLMEYFITVMFAMLGGLILNVMPCVLPVLSLKLFSIVKSAHMSKSYIKKSVIAMTGGILFSFFILALIAITLKQFGQYAGWGFHFQNAYFITFLVIIMILFASNLFGDFEINLPSFLPQKINDYISKRSVFYEHFLSGAFATILATPCTVPYLSPVVAFALMNSAVDTIILYLAIGFGMASPFFILMFFPQALKFLPKSGPWMITLKKIFALALLITAVWLIYVLSFMISGKALLALIFMVVLIKFFLTKINYITGKAFKPSVLLLLIAFTFYSIWHFDSEDKANTAIINKIWQNFNESELQNYIANGKIVLVDVTAEWCLMCKFNKLAVLNRDDVMQLLQKNNVILIKADLTHDSTESKAIKEFVKSHNHYGIPLNIVYGPNARQGIILPNVLTKNDIRNAIELAQNKY